MKAGQLTAPRRMELVDIPEPNIQEGEVLVRVEKISICGSDIRPFAAVLEELQLEIMQQLMVRWVIFNTNLRFIIKKNKKF